MISQFVQAFTYFRRGNNDGNNNGSNHHEEGDAGATVASDNATGHHVTLPNASNDNDDDTSPALVLSESIDSSPVADAKKSSSTHDDDDDNNNNVTATSITTTTHLPPSHSIKGSRAPSQQGRAHYQRGAKDQTLAKKLEEEEKKRRPKTRRSSSSISVHGHGISSQSRQHQNYSTTNNNNNDSKSDFDINNINVGDLNREFVRSLKEDDLRAIIHKFKPADADDNNHHGVYQMRNIIANMYNAAKSKPPPTSTQHSGQTSTQHSGGGRAKGKKEMKSAVVASRKSDRRSGKGSKRKAVEMDDDTEDVVEVGKKNKGTERFTKEYSKKFWAMKEGKGAAAAAAVAGNENDEDEKEESTNNFPHTLQHIKIGDKLVSGLTKDDIKKMPVDTMRSLNQKQIKACMKVIGGRTMTNGGGTEALRDELIKWKDTGYVVAGYSAGDRSEVMREKNRAGEVKTPFQGQDAMNKFNKVFYLPEIFPSFMRVKGNAFIIDETPEDQSDSNLEEIRKKLKFISVAEMMKTFVEYGFIIGPSDHAYLADGTIRSKKYERSRLELHHPDLTPDYKPH
ncbi:hypothetical protein ACHAWC_007199, partial [Mediolabrus comicus]